MGLYEWGSPPVQSTGAGTASNPSTSTLIAEIDSTQLGVLTNAALLGNNKGHKVPVRCTATLGASTTADWRVEHVLSTGLGSTAVRAVVPSIFTPTGQSGVYVYTFMLQPGDRVRARVNSSFTGNASAFLQVDALT